MNFEKSSQKETPKGSEDVEQIKSPAVRYRDEIYTASIHPDAVHKIKQIFPEANEREMESGYLTNQGRFVDRIEAVAIADTVDQIRKSVKSRKVAAEGLWSEDLKPEITYPDRAHLMQKDEDK